MANRKRSERGREGEGEREREKGRERERERERDCLATYVWYKHKAVRNIHAKKVSLERVNWVKWRNIM
jgi:hypothetical protein